MTLTNKKHVHFTESDIRRICKVTGVNEKYWLIGLRKMIREYPDVSAIEANLEELISNSKVLNWYVTFLIVFGRIKVTLKVLTLLRFQQKYLLKKELPIIESNFILRVTEFAINKLHYAPDYVNASLVMELLWMKLYYQRSFEEIINNLDEYEELLISISPL